ncbi:hypothetical protein HLB23_39660 [Nocardia uniformis]|uniref:Uncharacterized protein n=1 Tax=Nocardia uniformis TaxID=53432 RepID=A0A849CBA2_9NOCA|nr:hypothetical protein [Nocardia uniformis]NNH75904.1 hypothetical protein [Nocardia uniformis]
MNGGWITLGWIIVLGLPLAVLVATILWPERIPKDRTVDAIARRIQDEDGQPPTADAGR